LQLWVRSHIQRTFANGLFADRHSYSVLFADVITKCITVSSTYIVTVGITYTLTQRTPIGSPNAYPHIGTFPLRSDLSIYSIISYSISTQLIRMQLWVQQLCIYSMLRLQSYFDV
jgi:hypothetical protein